MRLDKFLHDAGYGSRKEIRQAIVRGRVAVEGETIKDPGAQVCESSPVSYDGVQVAYRKYHTLLMHKPEGTVSARKDALHPTVLDLLPSTMAGLDISPVGRLDKDTTGLLILTNDGRLSHRLTSPKQGVEKVYEFRYEGTLAPDAPAQVKAGLDLGDMQCLPGDLTLLGPGYGRLTICEGKFHQVKRMLAQLGGEVTQLARVQFGPLALPDDLAPGDWRYATPEEVDTLEKAASKETSR